MIPAPLRRLADRYLAAHHRLLGVPEGVVLVLGHMRSGSSLLLHLLMTRPEVLAAGERNTAYRSAAELDLLARDCFLVNRKPFGRVRYVADQLNHDRFLPEPQLILHHHVWPILLARRPGPAIGSMVRTFAGFGHDAAAHAAYYTARVETLTEYAALLRRAGRAPRLLTYEALTADPVRALEPLRRDLGLPGPFEAQYATHRFTGVRGDPSETLRSGAVRPDRGRAEPVPAELLAAAEAAWARLQAVALGG